MRIPLNEFEQEFDNAIGNNSNQMNFKIKIIHLKKLWTIIMLFWMRITWGQSDVYNVKHTRIRMKNILFALILIILMPSCGSKNKNEVTNKNFDSSLDEVILLKSQLSEKSNYSDSLLFELGKKLSTIKISIDDYNNNEIYKELKMKIVRSENFGDYITYGGFHFQVITNDFSDTELADDAAFELIYIPPDIHNYDDIRATKDKLEEFLKKYPSTNLKNTAMERISDLTKQIESGAQTIYD